MSQAKLVSEQYGGNPSNGSAAEGTGHGRHTSNLGAGTLTRVEKTLPSCRLFAGTDFPPQEARRGKEGSVLKLPCMLPD